ncbi:RNA polymerase sigma-70 factor (ECF subfamily) [Gracilibacillus halotolerans]|uniref:RNA polymerase sigma-70 factor (ECF subfamily) n=1 Tax=Gracilibacillus halotolerans TaxID=74386 RepID=A0A841RIE6_9BACI|nr:RNA polymerase sigma-70 factor (ECF subfamily) [Gracilibacillus halotolerans]
MEAKWVKKAKKGDKEALLQLILAKQDDYYRIAMSYMKNKEDALDVLEDMIVRLYENIHTLKNIDSFQGWSKKILINCCHVAYGKRKKTVYVEQEYLEAFADSEQEVSYEHLDAQIDIDRLLASISSPQAEAIRLKYIHDLDLETIA